MYIRSVVILLIIGVCSAQAQVLDATKKLEFEVASLRPALEGGFGTETGGPGTADPTHLNYENMTLRTLLMRAYGMETDQFVGPRWIDSDQFTVAANILPHTTKAQFQIMLQNLVTERFAITFRRETKELPVYELTLVDGGPRPTPAAAVDPAVPNVDHGLFNSNDRTSGKDGCRMMRPGVRAAAGHTQGGITCFSFINYPLSGAIHDLINWLNALDGIYNEPIHVIDNTGLSGDFDVLVRYHYVGARFAPKHVGTVTEQGSNSAQAIDPDGIKAPGPFEALEKQLGLRVKKGKGTVEVRFIDQVNRTPLDN